MGNGVAKCVAEWCPGREMWSNRIQRRHHHADAVRHISLLYWCIISILLFRAASYLAWHRGRSLSALAILSFCLSLFVGVFSFNGSSALPFGGELGQGRKDVENNEEVIEGVFIKWKYLSSGRDYLYINISYWDFKTFLSLMKPKRYRFIIIFLAPN